MFYTPWCGACKTAKPQFSAAADELAGDNKILIGGIDCDQFKVLLRNLYRFT